ncbi:unnamed protein product [Prunus armeniaca]
MEEGSPGVFPKLSRVTKRVRAAADCDSEYDVESGSNPISMQGLMQATKMDLRPESEHISRPTADLVNESNGNMMPNFLPGIHSFRDKLMNKVNMTKNVGIAINCLDTDYEGLNDEDDVFISRGERGPSIQFSDRAMARFCEPWKNALIVKLLGRSHTYNYLHDRLAQKWSLVGGWKLIDLVNDYFVVRFDLEEDLNFVLTGGPWMIAGQYLTIQQWRPGFCPSTAHITRMAAWIRVSAMQLECFDVWSLKRIGNLLGKLLKIDSLTTSQNRGKFARLCVELDLTKPLDAFVQINQNWYNIEYEGLPDICYLCGCYGHKRESCTMKSVNLSDEAGKAQGAGVGPMNHDSVGVTETVKMAEDSLRGPWMNVQPRRRPKTIHKDVPGQGSGGRNKGSRFDALNEIGEDFDISRPDNVNQVPTRGVPIFKSVEEVGQKVWTKSKHAKSGSRPVLNDISNKNVQKVFNSKVMDKSSGSSDKFTMGASRHSRNQVVGGRKPSTLSAVTEHLDSWGDGQHIHQEKGVYIFGHQPPNITTHSEFHDEDTILHEDASEYDDDNVLVPRGIDLLGQVAKMDLVEGQTSTSGGNLTSTTFNTVEGMAFDA